jgi:hypothetical protein
MSSMAQGGSVADQVKLAAEAYVYGYPLVYSLEEIGAFVAGSDRFPMTAPFNEFGHARALADSEFKFVSPNNDTLYSIAMCDVREAPLVLRVPDTADRYYVLQFVDAWSNNFAYVGRRATGTGEAGFLLAEAGYSGDVPEGLRVIHAPTGVFVIVGRIQVDGEADLPAVHALQDLFTLRPVSGRGGAAADAPVVGVPVPDPRVAGEVKWWEQCRVALAAFPPPAADSPYLELGAQFGLSESESPYVSPDADRDAVLAEGAKAGHSKIEELMKQVHTSPAGWQSAMHLFDYNLDFHEIGTLNTPEWRMTDRTTAYVTRAVVARAGLWGNHGYEADYEIVWVDSEGDPLDGTNNYELHLESQPPVDAFWSLTMYDVPNFYLVANPINRYSIGDRTPGLVIDSDGSLTIYFGNKSPGEENEPNWLPAPNGPFRPIMRLYQPQQPVLDGSYTLPPIKRTR